MPNPPLRTNAAFRRYWLGRLASYAGDQMARIALLIAVFDRYGGVAVSLVLIAGTAPRMLGPVLGPLADRYSQRLVMVTCDVVQAVAYLILAAIGPSLPAVVILVAVAATAATGFTPAGRSLVPQLVDAQTLPAANAALAVAVNAGIASGPALGGLLYGTLGLSAALLANVASFVVSAILLAAGTGRLGHLQGLQAPAPVRVRRRFAQAVRASLADVRGDAVVRAICIAFFVSVAFGGLDNVAVVPLGRAVLHASPFLVGLLGTGYGVGMVAAPLLLLRARRRPRPVFVLYLGLAGFGLGTALTGISPVLAAALAGQALAGAGNGWENVGADTTVQQHVPADRLGSVFGTIYLFPYAAELLAYLVGGALLDRVGPRVVLIISGVGVLATLLVVQPLLARIPVPCDTDG